MTNNTTVNASTNIKLGCYSLRLTLCPLHSFPSDPTSSIKYPTELPSSRLLSILPSHYQTRIPKFRFPQDQWRSFIGAFLMELDCWEELATCRSEEQIYERRSKLKRLSTGRWIQEPIIKTPQGEEFIEQEQFVSTLSSTTAGETESGTTTTTTTALQTSLQEPTSNNTSIQPKQSHSQCFKSINVSHSKDYIFYGCAHNCHLGVDIQHFDLKRFSLQMVEAVFTPLELKQCEFHKERIAMFWCLKEAILKALGFGMGFDPKKIEIRNESWVSETKRMFPSPGASTTNQKQLDMKEFSLYIKNERRKDWALYVNDGICGSGGKSDSADVQDYYCVAVALAPLKERFIHDELQEHLNRHATTMGDSSHTQQQLHQDEINIRELVDDSCFDVTLLEKDNVGDLLKRHFKKVHGR